MYVDGRSTSTASIAHVILSCQSVKYVPLPLLPRPQTFTSWSRPREMGISLAEGSIFRVLGQSSVFQVDVAVLLWWASVALGMLLAQHLSPFRNLLHTSITLGKRGLRLNTLLSMESLIQCRSFGSMQAQQNERKELTKKSPKKPDLSGQKMLK